MVKKNKSDDEELARRSLLQMKENARKLYPTLNDVPDDKNASADHCDEEDEEHETEHEKYPSTLKTSPKAKYSEIPKPAIHILDSQNHTTKQSNNSYLYLTVFVALIALALYFLKFEGNTSNTLINVDTVISGLKSDYNSNLPDNTIRVIKASLRKQNKAVVKEPSIILLLVDPSVESKSAPFAEKLLKLILEKESPLIMEGNYLSRMEPDLAKRHIDDTLQHNLSDSRLNAVMVTHLDMIPGEAALMFHSYLDHETATFKKVVYVLTVLSKVSISKDSGIADWDRLVQDHLRKAWSCLREDQVEPLLARMTVSVAAVNSGRG